jgi:hypothetical protein
MFSITCWLGYVFDNLLVRYYVFDNLVRYYVFDGLVSYAATSFNI